MKGATTVTYRRRFVLVLALLGFIPTAHSQTNQPGTAAQNQSKTDDQQTSMNWNQQALVGFDVSAASAVDPEQKLFAGFNAQAPLGGGGNFFKSHFILWFSPKITSVPKPSALPVSSLISQFGNFNLGDTKLADLVQGIEFEGGGEIPIKWHGNTGGIPGVLPNTEVRTGFSAIFGGSAITPLSSSNAIIFSQRNSTIDNYYKQLNQPIPAMNTSVNPPVAYDVIAFVPQERSRFYRGYFAGVRFKFYYWCKKSPEDLTGGQSSKAAANTPAQAAPVQAAAPAANPPAANPAPANPAPANPPAANAPSAPQPAAATQGPGDMSIACQNQADNVLPVFPGIFDLKVGQNEFVSGGKFRGVIVKLDASFPLPINKVPIYIFGSLAMRAARNVSSAPLIISAPTGMTAPAITDNNVFVQPVNSLDRDVYTLGLGIDLMHITSVASWVKAHGQSVGQKQAGQTSSANGTSH